LVNVFGADYWNGSGNGARSLGAIRTFLASLDADPSGSNRSIAARAR
jgi:hypothetical protein